MASPVLKRVDDVLELDLSPCRGSEFQDALAKIKDVPGRRFDYDRKLWLVPAEPSVADRVLRTVRPQADAAIHAWVRESRTQETNELTTPLPPDADLQIPWATCRMPWQPEVVNDEKFDGLFDWQRAAVDLMASAERVILADDMGLGKTLQAISAVEEWRLRNGAGDGLTFPEGPRLIVCPNSVKGSWMRELRRWLPDDTQVHIIDGTTAQARHNQLRAAVAENAWIIVNWEQLRVKKEVKKIKRRNGAVSKKTVTVMKEPLFEETKWLAIVADEVHRAKNRKSQQTQGLWRLQASVMYGLSGTPLMNSPDELWAILHWLWPKEYTSYWRFFMDYCDFWEDTHQRKVVTGVKNPDALRFELKGRLARRTAAILGLKGRRRFPYPVALNPKQRKLYDEAERVMWLEVQRAIEEGDKSALEFAQAAAEGATISTLYNIPNGAARMTRLLQIIENPALLGGEDDSALMDDFEERYENSRPSQWVVGCKFVGSCTLLANRLRSKYGARVGVYTGEVDPKERTKLEDAFQNGELDVLVGTLASTYQGITLTAAHLMYQLTLDFVPAINEQWESRCDRLGQQELVRIYRPLAENTVADNKVRIINNVKEKIVQTVVSKDEIQEVYNEDCN